MPIVYILTNEAMPGLVKIGRTGDGNLEARLRQMNTTAVPLPFECFYAVKVPDARAIEKRLHQGLYKCRVRDRREFFETAPEHAKALLSIAEAMGGEDVTPKGPVVAEATDTQALEKAHKKLPRFHFGLAGIEVGERLQFKRNSTIECEVVNDSQVRFRDEVMSLSRSASIILKEIYNWKASPSGPEWWCWHVKTLDDLRRQ